MLWSFIVLNIIIDVCIHFAKAKIVTNKFKQVGVRQFRQLIKKKYR